jgi:hypothetical protein
MPKQINGLDVIAPASISLPSVYTATVTIVSAGSTLALGTLTIAGIPAGRTVTHLFVHHLFGERSDSSGATNALNGAQNLQVKNNAGGFNTFFSYAGGEYSTGASAQGGGGAEKGTVDLAAALAPVNGDVLTFQWTTAKATGNNLILAEFEIIVEMQVS